MNRTSLFIFVMFIISVLLTTVICFIAGKYLAGGIVLIVGIGSAIYTFVNRAW